MSHHLHHRRRYLLLIGLGTYLIMLGALIWNRYQLLTNPTAVESSPIHVIAKPKPTIEPTKTVVPVDLPAEALIKVPFTTQAPLAIWDATHEEACEEASLLMVYYFRTNQQFSSPIEADAQINKLITWEEKNGYKVDLTAQELVTVASGYMKLKTGRVITNPTIEQLKTELNAGRPVIVPAAGRELHNPNFTPPGPIYHMLVLKGYDKDGLIVNDPGTRNGESYRYTFDRIMSAMHSWNPDNILNGQKAVVVFD